MNKRITKKKTKQPDPLVPDLPEVLDFWLTNRLMAVHTAIPGAIQNYDPVTRKCDVQPSVRLPFPGGKFLDAPVIQSVPVCIPGSAQYMLDFEIPDGTTCLVHFSEAGIGGWLNGAEQPDADGPSRFKLTDAMVIPGLWQYGKVPEVVNGILQKGDDVEIKAKGTQAINANAIELNGNTKSFVTHAELNTALQAMLTLVNTHTHLYTPGPGTAIPTAVPVPLATLDISASATTTIKTDG